MSNQENKMVFKPIYFPEKIKVINPCGYVGVVTLWSDPDWVLKKIKEAGVNLLPENSPVAAAGTLYGNGLPEMLRNLLYNPQITKLVLFGKDKSGSAKQLQNFFQLGLEEIDFLGTIKFRIKGTNRIIDGMVQRETFSHPPEILTAGDGTSLSSIEELKNIFTRLESLTMGELERKEILMAGKRSGMVILPEISLPGARVEIPMPVADVTHFTSNPRNHSIVEDDALSAWRELVFRLVRFGYRVKLKKGERLELQNVRVVVEKPDFIDEAQLEKFNFNPKELKRYYESFTGDEIPPDTAYTYGNRIKAYFGIDSIKKVIENFKHDPENRQSYVSLWDTSKDLSSSTSHPCLVSLFFRKFENKLTLTATFRTHNIMDAWLKNFYGLLRVQREVSGEVGIEPGAISMISHSISIDTRMYEIAKCIADSKKFSESPDPCGNFTVEVSGGEIVVKHYHMGVKIDEYCGTKASYLSHQLYRNCAISDINHALYMGRMLERAERCLRTGEEFKYWEKFRY